MKLLLIIISALLLTGCASSCREACILGFGPGNALFDAMANHYDTADGCQMKNKPQGYQLPSYCGSSKAKTIIVTGDGQRKTYYVTNR